VSGELEASEGAVTIPKRLRLGVLSQDQFLYEDEEILAVAMMGEAQAVGEKLGARFRVPMEKRIAGAEGVGKHKTSMLQDLEAGKPMEIEGMLGVVIELAEMTKIEVPTLRSLYACVSLLDRAVRDGGIRVRGTPVQ